MSSPPTAVNADAAAANNGRRFIIVAPTADRPQLMRSCLDSLWRHEQLHGRSRRCRLEVLLADDSLEAVHVRANAGLADEFRRRGLAVEHFPPVDQAAIVAALGQRSPRLQRVIGPPPQGAAPYGHKGQAAMRNIAWLHLATQMRSLRDEDALIWSIDSDQQFRAPANNLHDPEDGHDIDYLAAFDRIFGDPDIELLSGKVVGDPPVSPAVMMRNFLDDVIAFLVRARHTPAQAPCRHHGAMAAAGDAAYHDMAELFGFAGDGAAFDYPCPLTGAHSEAQCFSDFAARLNDFFHGEHPTRSSLYQRDDPLASVQPARTVYAGNYIFRAAALKYFIPFAHLRLRMSGPTLGRILRAEIGPRFVTANLPMLHQRTIADGGAEYRPGVCDDGDSVDLGDEFERQFLGDVMLFSVEQLCREGPLTTAAAAAVASVIDATQAQMLSAYNQRRQPIIERTATIERLLQEPTAWWRDDAALAPARRQFAAFTANVRRNFDAAAPGYQRINDATLWRRWRHDLIAAICAYGEDRAQWEQVLCAR